MANWALPTLTSTYSDFLSYLNARDTDLALQFDGTSTTGMPTGTIRWNGTNKYWEKYSGSAWNELVPRASSKYIINVDMVDSCNVDDTITSTSTLWTSSKISAFASGYVTSTALTTTLANYVLKNGENGVLTLGSNDTNAVNIETNNTNRLSISGTGNVTIAAPSSGVAFTVTPIAGSNAIVTSGNIQANVLISNVATGTAPLTVSSTTVVTNLNAHRVNGYTWATANTASSIVARDSSGNFSAGTITASLSGNSSTATKLATSRTINGVAFDGSSNINIEDRLGTTIASASSLVIGTSGYGNTIRISGTTTITSLGVSTTGVRRTLIFDGTLTITYNATSLVLPNGGSITVSAGDSMDFVCENGTNGYWRCYSYNKHVGTLQEFLTALE
jgi:hypothetical protein